MPRLRSVPLESGVVNVAFTDRSDGDFRTTAPASPLEAARRAVVDAPWTWLRQIHGERVIQADEAGAGAGSDADGAVTDRMEAPLAIMTADCAPVVLIAERGFAVVHAGWRGLVAGVVDNAAQRLAVIGGRPVEVLVGPCINPAAYEFGGEDLAAAVDVFGDDVRSVTAWGSPALDVPAAVAVACERAGWPRPTETPPCTSDERWYSHRTRGDVGRQATVAWMVAC